jgi:hypothetical protein
MTGRLTPWQWRRNAAPEVQRRRSFSAALAKERDALLANDPDSPRVRPTLARVAWMDNEPGKGGADLTRLLGEPLGGAGAAIDRRSDQVVERPLDPDRAKIGKATGAAGPGRGKARAKAGRAFTTAPTAKELASAGTPGIAARATDHVGGRVAAPGPDPKVTARSTVIFPARDLVAPLPSERRFEACEIRDHR